TPRRRCRRRRARSRAGRTFSRQVRLGEVGSGAAEDLVLLLKQPDLFARRTQLGRFFPALAGAVAVVDVGLADPLMERHFVDAEVLRDLRDDDAVLTGPGHSHDVFAELLGGGSGHGAHHSRPPCGQARSVVTYPCGRTPSRAAARASTGSGTARPVRMSDRPQRARPRPRTAARREPRRTAPPCGPWSDPHSPPPGTALPGRGSPGAEP